MKDLFQSVKSTVQRRANIARLFVATLFLASAVIVGRFSGLPLSKHLGGALNLLLAASLVHGLDASTDRWSLYEQIIEQENLAVAVAYAGWVVGACVAAPSSIL